MTNEVRQLCMDRVRFLSLAVSRVLSRQQERGGGRKYGAQTDKREEFWLLSAPSGGVSNSMCIFGHQSKLAVMDPFTYLMLRGKDGIYD